MSYKNVQAEYRRRYGNDPVIQPCWIADVKEKRGETRGPAHNRKGEKPTKPCPPDIFPKLEALMVELGEIRTHAP